MDALPLDVLVLIIRKLGRRDGYHFGKTCSRILKAFLKARNPWWDYKGILFAIEKNNHEYAKYHFANWNKKWSRSAPRIKIFEQFWRHFNDHWSFAFSVFECLPNSTLTFHRSRVFRNFVRTKGKKVDKEAICWFLRMGADPFACHAEVFHEFFLKDDVSNMNVLLEVLNDEDKIARNKNIKDWLKSYIKRSPGRVGKLDTVGMVPEIMKLFIPRYYSSTDDLFLVASRHGKRDILAYLFSVCKETFEAGKKEKLLHHCYVKEVMSGHVSYTGQGSFILNNMGYPVSDMLHFYDATKHFELVRYRKFVFQIAKKHYLVFQRALVAPCVCDQQKRVIFDWFDMFFKNSWKELKEREMVCELEKVGAKIKSNQHF